MTFQLLPPDKNEEPVAQAGDLIMKFMEVEGQDGLPPRSVSIVGIEFQPLDYEQLAASQLHKPVSIPLNWRHAKVLETDIAGLDLGALTRGYTSLESPYSSVTVSLQRGGWLPSGLAMSRGDLTILPDRNVISQIKSRYDAGVTIVTNKDFIDMVADHEVRINPLLFAIEGNNRRIPDADTVEAQLGEVTRVLRKSLPKAKLVIGDGSLRGALGLIEDLRRGFDNKTAFLLEIAPALVAPTSGRLLDKRWEEVLAAADHHDVARDTLVVLAALSAVSVRNSGSPAKKLLKFHGNYGPEDAYNALADLRSLDLLIQILALFPEERPALFTADKALALFWTGIQANNFMYTSGAVSYDLSPVDELLPGDTRERWKRDSQSARAL